MNPLDRMHQAAWSGQEEQHLKNPDASWRDDQHGQAKTQKRRRAHSTISNQQITRDNIDNYIPNKAREEFQGYPRRDQRNEQQEGQVLERHLQELLVGKLSGAAAASAAELKWKELREMDEDQLYIERLRHQRKRINEIQGEFEAKVDYYSSLEQEIKELTKYRAYYEKYTQLQEVAQETLQKLERMTVSHKESTKQVEQLHQTLNEQNNQSKAAANEIERLTISNKQLMRSQKEISEQLRTQNEKFIMLDSMLERQRAESRESSVKMLNEATSLKELSDQIVNMKLENYQVNEQLAETKRQCEKSKEEKQILIKEMSRKQGELQILRDQSAQTNQTQTHLQDKIALLQEELQEQRSQRNQQYQQQQCQCHKTEELTKSRALNAQLSQEFDSAVRSIKLLENEITFYRRENYTLKLKLSSYLTSQPDKQILREELDSLEDEIFAFKKNNQIHKNNNKDKIHNTTCKNSYSLQHEDYNENKHQLNYLEQKKEYQYYQPSIQAKSRELWEK